MKYAGPLLVAPALLLRESAAAIPPTRRRVGAPSAQRPRVRRRAQATLAVVGNNGAPAAAFPLAACQGDCDDDAECQEGLVCFQREAGDPLPPGCAGVPHNSNGEDNGNDFCYDPAASVPNLFDQITEVVNLFAPAELAVVGNGGAPSGMFPLAECQGDCDNDAECQEGLVCFLRVSGGALPPGCFGSPNHLRGEIDNGNDFCYDPVSEIVDAIVDEIVEDPELAEEIVEEIMDLVEEDPELVEEIVEEIEELVEEEPELVEEIVEVIEELVEEEPELVEEIVEEIEELVEEEPELVEEIVEEIEELIEEEPELVEEIVEEIEELIEEEPELVEEIVEVIEELIEEEPELVEEIVEVIEELVEEEPELVEEIVEEIEELIEEEPELVEEIVEEIEELIEEEPELVEEIVEVIEELIEEEPELVEEIVNELDDELVAEVEDKIAQVSRTPPPVKASSATVRMSYAVAVLSVAAGGLQWLL